MFLDKMNIKAQNVDLSFGFITEHSYSCLMLSLSWTEKATNSTEFIMGEQIILDQPYMH